MKPLSWQEGIGERKMEGLPSGKWVPTAALFFSLCSQNAMILVSVLIPSWEDHFEEQGELRMGH